MDDSKNLYTIGPLADYDRIKRVVYWIGGLIMTALCAVFLLYLVNGMYREMWVAGCSVLPIAVALELNRRGYLQGAGSILAVSLTLMITVLATMGKGIYDVGVVAYPGILIIASLLLRRSSIVYLTALIIFCVGWLVFGAVNGVYQPNYPTESIPRQFLFVIIILLVTAAAIQVLSSTLRGNAMELKLQLEKGRQTEGALREAEELYRNIIEKTSVINYRDSAEALTRTLYISPQIEAVLGFSQAEWLSTPGFWVTVTHPDDLPIVHMGIESLLSGNERNISEYRLKARNGGWVWFRDEAVLIKAENGAPKYIHGVLFNITERKIAEAKVQQREAILNAMAEAAQRLLRATDWRAEIDGILKLLGMASGASHVYIFENHPRPEDGILLSSMTYEWAAPGIRAELHNPNYQDSYLRPVVPGLEDWYANLSAGRFFYGSAREYPRFWKKVFEGQGLKTLLDVPILVHGKWWGILGFDDYVDEMRWSQAEIDALMAAAGVLGTAIERQQSDAALRSSEEKFQLAFHRTFVPMVISTAERQIILDVNRAFCDGIGYTREEVVGRAVPDLGLWAHSADQERHRNTLAKQGYDEEFKAEFRRKSGETGVALISGITIRIGDELCLLHTFYDITKIDELLIELKVKNEELQSFTYTVSHDLRAPLITLSGFVGYLEDDARKGNIERVLRDTGRIKEAVGKMERLLSELLELSRIGRLMNPPQDVLFAEIIQDALQAVQGRLHARQVEVILPSFGFPVVHGDRVRLTEVVQNLVDNAAKFMGDQQAPRIEIGVMDQDASPIFFIKDNGIGIEPALHEKVFGLFNKLDPNSEGTGIGLAVVKKIVEVHGGKIWLESRGIGHGTTFFFSLTSPQATRTLP